MTRAFADGAGAAALATLLTLVAQMLPAGSMAPGTWVLACTLAAACSAFLWRSRFGPSQPRGWLQLAGTSVLLAAIFFGANGALDALNGPRPSPLDSGGSLGGFELCYALCPGLTSIALAGWVRSLCRTPAAGC